MIKKMPDLKICFANINTCSIRPNDIKQLKYLANNFCLEPNLI